MREAMLLAAMLAWCGPALAVGRLADVQVIDRTTGSTLQVYEHRGKHYIVGEPGHEYGVSVTSREGGRLMAVGSVDGVNIVSGNTAAIDQGGYVLAPRQNFSINGWRTSMQSTAAFYFTTVADSYAARTGRPDDLGVIGFAFYREKSRTPCCGWMERQAPAPSMKSEVSGQAQRDERIGTGYGRSEYSQVEYTDFERASQRPDEVLALNYDSYENLCKKGVIPSKSRWQRHDPQPFPGGHFVPAP
jgi:hypothetical protein